MPELKQTSFNDENNKDLVIPEAFGEPHLACVLLLDTSISMEGQPIESLNNAINMFKTATCMDELAQKRVDVAIVEFNSSARIVQPFVPISRMEPVHMHADGCTSMGAGINLAIDLVKERTRLYAQLGTPRYAPWIIMITDGDPTDDITEAARRIKEEESKGTHGKLKFWSIGVPGYNLKTLAQLSQERRIIELAGYNFEGIFNWISDSMVTISVSQVDEKVKYSQLPDDAQVVRTIPDNW